MTSTGRPLTVIGRGVVAFVIVPSLALYVLAQLLHFRVLAVCDAEFLALGAVWAWLPEVIGCLAILWLILTAILHSVVHTFGIPLAPVQTLSAGAVMLPTSTVSLWCVSFAIAVVVLSVVAVRIGPRGPDAKRWLPITMVVVLVIGLGLDFTTGNGLFWTGALRARKADVRSTGIELLRFPEAGLARAEWDAWHELRHGGGTLLPIRGASDSLTAGPGRAHIDVVLIVAESWGISTDDSLNQAFRQIYLSRHLEDRYNFRMGTTPFRGTTVFGESRELCHRDYGFAIETEPADSLQSCLPYAFRAAGYRAIGIHGNSGVLFSRNVWYPNVGFQETWFTPDFARQHLPRCPGFFPGICDAAITEWIGDSLAGPWKDTATFVYWMSLNSHLPVDRSTDPRAVLFCGVSPVTRDDDAVCSWYVLERRLHEAVATLASRTDIPPTEFMIVGDHTPPFAAENRRAEFSQTVVPYFLLEPKTIAVPAPR